jgi:hypothetical protein
MCGATDRHVFAIVQTVFVKVNTKNRNCDVLLDASFTIFDIVTRGPHPRPLPNEELGRGEA